MLMVEAKSPGTYAAAALGVAAHAVVAPIGLDDWSDVRHLHWLAFQKLIGVYLEHGEAEAFKAVAASCAYSQDLRRADLIGARIDGHLAGTCGWKPADDAGASARLTGLFVSPLFTRVGLGRRLVEDTEALATAAGFQVFTAHAPAGAIDFFGSLGYEIASHGVHSIDGKAGIPVAFMRKAAHR